MCLKGFWSAYKAYLITLLVAAVLIFGGVFVLSNDNTASNLKKGGTVDLSLLIPEGSFITSGFDGEGYIPASDSAKVTLVEFGDYECPACTVYHPFVKQILTEFSGEVSFVFRNYPLSYHKNADIASYAVEAAGLQGKYWQMHDIVFENTTDWADSGDAQKVFIGYAQNLEMDTEKYASDINSDVIKNKILSDKRDGDQAGIDATPTFFINGRKIELRGNYETFRQAILSEIDKNN